MVANLSLLVFFSATTTTGYPFLSGLNLPGSKITQVKEKNKGGND